MITRESAIRAASGMLPRLLATAGLTLGAEDAVAVVKGVAELLGRLVPEDAPVDATVGRLERVDERP